VIAGEEEALRPKHYRTSVVLTGLAPDEVDVSMYVAALQGFDLLESVMPDSTEVIEINDVPMRKFTLTMSINTEVEDAFEVEQVGGEDAIASQLEVSDRVVTASEREEN
jgi:hypothetical protein